MGAGISRRTFIGTSAAGTAALLGAGRQAFAEDPAVQAAGGTTSETRIRKVYLAKPVPTWPKPNLDVAEEIKRIEGELAGLAGKMEGIRLEGGDLYRKAEDVPDTAEALGNPDGLLVFNLTSTLGGHIERLSGTKIPTILYSQPYSGQGSAAIRQRAAPGDFLRRPRERDQGPGGDDGAEGG